MATIYFRLNEQQEREIKQLMKIEGYLSRSEFLRFVIKFYKYHQEKYSAPKEVKDWSKRGEKARWDRIAGDDIE